MERVVKLNIAVRNGEECRSSWSRVPSRSYKEKEKKNAEQRL